MADSSAPTTAQRSIRIPDDDWYWLAQWAAANGMERGSVIRRLLTVLRTGSTPTLRGKVLAVDDPIPAKRQANLLHQPTGADR